MTDEQIVRTLAEFMDLSGPRDEGWKIVKMVTGQIVAVDTSDGYVCQIPNYLTSYDALAPVWERIDDMTYDSAISRMAAGFYWYDHPPRQHAEALAAAILEAKEKS